MAGEVDTSPIDRRTLLREGSRILGILLVWGVPAAFGYYGITTLGAGDSGAFFSEVGSSLAFVFVTLGLLCAFFYVVARGVQLSDRRST